MTSIAAQVRTTVGRLFFRPAAVTQVTSLTPTFLKLRLDAPSLRGDAVEVGDKVQVLIPELGMRTYTPFERDPARGAFSLLAYLHDDGPGARWLRAVTPRQQVQFFGPRRSLALSAGAGPMLLVGDETSFALLAALQQHRQDTRAVLEVSASAEAATALAALGATATVIQRTSGDAHLPAMEAALRGALCAEATLVFTGRARTIQALRAGLRAQPALHAKQHVKAYWADGKRGID